MRGNSTARSRWHPGIRVRVTTLATVVVAVTLLASGVALTALLKQSLIAGLDSAQLDRAQAVASIFTADVSPGTIPMTAEENSLVQVIDASGSVVAATSNIEGEAPVLASPPSARRSTTLTLPTSPVGGGSAFRVAAVPVQLTSGPGWVYVSGSLAPVDTAIANVSALFAISFPPVLLAVGLTVWFAVSRSLRPVEGIRRRASAIDARDMSARVPVPAGRDEISRLAVTMNMMLDRLEMAAARQQQFVGDASHELRSPLAALRAQADVALAHPDAETASRVLSVVRDQAQRMTVLIDDLLLLARQHEVDSRPAAEHVDLDELALVEVRRLRERGGGNVDVTLDALDAARVTGSRRDLARALRNLGDNALAHARSEVTVALSTSGSVASVSVTDDGPGIPVEDRERIFERFARLDDSRARDGSASGFGLGLAIARDIVEAHGGTLTVDGRPDGASGARFVLRLGLAAESVAIPKD